MMSLLYRLYAIESRTLRSLIRKVIMKIEKGEFYSLTLHKIFNDYHGVEIDL